MSLKSTEELCVMTMKNNGKFDDELTVISKLTWGIWWILTRALVSLKNFHFNGLLLSKVYIVWATKVEELSFMKLKRDTKFEEKLTCCLVNDMRNLANFYQSTWKCQNWNFDKTLLSKVENLQWTYVSWQWIIIQKLTRNWLVNLQLTRETSQILTRALESLKNFLF